MNPRIPLSVAALLFAPPAFAGSYSDQWGLANTGQTVCAYDGSQCMAGKPGIDIHHEEVRELTKGFDCSSVIVAVLDSGADYDHPGLAGNLLPGKTFLQGEASDGAKEDNDHGTHVTGIIAANGSLENGGISGVCQKARVLEVKIANAQGYPDDASIIAGIRYAAEQGARVVNVSLGGPAPNDLIKEALVSAPGTLFVIASGNGDSFGTHPIGFDIDRSPEYPASYELENTVTVAATDANDQLATFSNYGASAVALAAPGVNIMSTLPMMPTDVMKLAEVPTKAGALSGTSMAAPFVTGAAALLWAQDPSLPLSEVKTRLLAAVDKVDALTGKVRSGGRLNLRKLFP